MSNRILCILLFTLSVFLGCNTREISFFPKTPEGRWWIVVGKFRGPFKDQQADETYKILLNSKDIDRSKIKKRNVDSYIIIGYGNYHDYKSRKAKADLKAIQSIITPEGFKIFWSAHFEPIPEPTPAINPEYLLRNVKGYWTLEIARFTGPGRKKRATEFTKELRNQNIPAYLHHGMIRSVVTIGSYPENAVRTSRKYVGILKIVDPNLRMWKRRFPHIQVNGKYVRFRPINAKKFMYKPTEVKKISNIIEGGLW